MTRPRSNYYAIKKSLNLVIYMVIEGVYSHPRFITRIKAVHACVYPPIILSSIHSCVPSPPILCLS